MIIGPNRDLLYKQKNILSVQLPIIFIVKI
jgi:hypothetical protein